MKVEIWSDIACPFCYIGKRKFEQGLEQFMHNETVDVTYKSFQLDPNAAKQQNQSMSEMLAKKIGVSIEQAKEMNRHVASQASEVGLTYHLDTAIPTNTLDAHRLIQYAATEEKMDAMKERLLKAYFTESKNVADHSTLTLLAEEVGLDKQGVENVLFGNAYLQEVQNDQREGSQLGLQGVPFFVINRKYAVSGAQSPETFLSVLNKVWDEENPKADLKTLGETGASCTDDSCTP
jgi:predicted DsbA family dithiol-disulfide isomerase